MINAKEAYKLAHSNLTRMIEKDNKSAETFISSTIEPLITSSVDQGAYFIEKEFPIEEVSNYSLPAIKRVLENLGYACEYSTLKCIPEQKYVKIKISWFIPDNASILENK